jgi:hypothetical protein
MIAATKTARQLGRSTYLFNSSLADATETRMPSTPWCRSVDIIISRDASCDPLSLRRPREVSSYTKSAHAFQATPSTSLDLHMQSGHDARYRSHHDIMIHTMDIVQG